MYKYKNNFLLNITVLLAIVFSACTNSNVVNNEPLTSAQIEDVKDNIDNYQKFDANVKYKYNGDDIYTETIVDYMLSHATVSNADLLYLPAPVIVSIDENDKKDIKAYGTFYIYGVNVVDDLFNVVDDYKYSGCFHIENSDNKFTIKNIEYAMDGINFELSLYKITNQNMTVVNDVIMSNDEESDIAKKIITESANDYVVESNLNIKGIKISDKLVFYFNDNIDENEKKNIYNIRENIDKLISENYGDRGYTVLNFNNKTFTRKIWRYGIGDAMEIFLEDSLDAEHKDNYLEAWETLVESVVEATNTAKEYLNTNKLNDYHFEVLFLDDRDYTTVLIDVIDGEIKYNIVENK